METPDPWEQFFDALIGGMAEGKVKLISVGPMVCGKCKKGTPKGSPTPNWMNRTVCDQCGHQASR